MVFRANSFPLIGFSWLMKFPAGIDVFLTRCLQRCLITQACPGRPKNVIPHSVLGVTLPAAAPFYGLFSCGVQCTLQLSVIVASWASHLWRSGHLTLKHLPVGVGGVLIESATDYVPVRKAFVAAGGR